MYAFTLERPTSLADAVKLAEAGAKPLAGGQTLLASMKLRLSAPDQLADLAGVKELTGISKSGDAFVIGAMSRHLDVANNDPAACYPSAVLGSGATIVTSKREIAADDFFQGLFTTALEDGELIKAIRFPIPQRAAYVKLRQKASNFPLVGVFLAQYASGVRVAVTGAGNGVFRHKGLEDALTQSFTPEAAAGVKIDAGDLNSDLHASAAYRANLISVLTQRAVAKVLG